MNFEATLTSLVGLRIVLTLRGITAQWTGRVTKIDGDSLYQETEGMGGTRLACVRISTIAAWEVAREGEVPRIAGEESPPAPPAPPQAAVSPAGRKRKP